LRAQPASIAMGTGTLSQE